MILPETMENILESNKVRTFMGREIDPILPDPELINLVDIAHSLSNICRWNGHAQRFYSVAQHCIFVANLCENHEDKISAMFHDASEAYISDITRPVKRHLLNYLQIEENLMKIIAAKFGFQYPLSAAVTEADDYAVKWEYHNIVLNDRAQALPPVQAKRAFMEAIEILTPYTQRGL
ncbi:MAG: hypothetical protein NT004_06305 [Bacteroidetes bacterium]|nr:hypothetical protein [Bacteroidota bacterium]